MNESNSTQTVYGHVSLSPHPQLPSLSDVLQVLYECRILLVKNLGPAAGQRMAPFPTAQLHRADKVSRLRWWELGSSRGERVEGWEMIVIVCIAQSEVAVSVRHKMVRAQTTRHANVCPQLTTCCGVPNVLRVPYVCRVFLATKCVQVRALVDGPASRCPLLLGRLVEVAAFV